MANQEDFTHLARALESLDSRQYLVHLTTNTVVGYRAGAGLGIYTLRDSGGAKDFFDIVAAHEH